MPLIALAGIVAAILAAEREPRLKLLFRWLPVPLWCYALPAIAVTLDWLPREFPDQPIYRPLTTALLPVALALLLFGVDLAAVGRAGRRALRAAAMGALGIAVGAPVGVWLLQGFLPAEAWKGAGALAGTWTGGTMNLLALRTVLETPDSVFAPLIIVDALIAYRWMALLVAASSAQEPINRWCGAREVIEPARSAAARARAGSSGGRAIGAAVGLAVGVALAAQAIGSRLPTAFLIHSGSGWAVLLVTTTALALSLVPRVRALGPAAERMGLPCLYLVLAASGAQGSLSALWTTPAWVGVGVVAMLAHAAALAFAARRWRLPLGLVATASQANVGGVVSAPLVGAVYHQSLAPVGLVLALAGNAIGTYLGIASATLCRWLVGT
jgi:uncharacterized membrane protein